jgi:hypothetical protein
MPNLLLLMDPRVFLHDVHLQLLFLLLPPLDLCTEENMLFLPKLVQCFHVDAWCAWGPVEMHSLLQTELLGDARAMKQVVGTRTPLDTFWETPEQRSAFTTAIQQHTQWVQETLRRVPSEEEKVQHDEWRRGNIGRTYNEFLQEYSQKRLREGVKKKEALAPPDTVSIQTSEAFREWQREQEREIERQQAQEREEREIAMEELRTGAAEEGIGEEEEKQEEEEEEDEEEEEEEVVEKEDTAETAPARR